jgi:hypothetical protein
LKILKDAGQDTSTRSVAAVGLSICDAIFLVADGLNAAPGLSTTGFLQGVDSLRSYHPASTFLAGFAPGALHDGARAYRLFAFDDGCGCFRYSTPVRPAA